MSVKMISLHRIVFQSALVIFLTAGIGFLALGPNAAWAKENKTSWTFNVPVKLSNIHEDIKAFTVYCFVYESSNRLLGSGKSSFPLSKGNRNFNQTVSVNAKIRIPRQSDPKAFTYAKSWQCQLGFTGKDGKADYVINEKGRKDAYTPKPGTPFKLLVKGTF